jgi:hypothetical protein
MSYRDKLVFKKLSLIYLSYHLHSPRIIVMTVSLHSSDQLLLKTPILFHCLKNRQ